MVAATRDRGRSARLLDDQRLQVGAEVWPAAAAVAALAPHLSEARLDRMDAVLARRVASVALALEDLHHSHNGAACLRTADALGLQDVVAVETTEPFPLPEAEAPRPGRPPIARKISKTAHRWLDLHPVDGGEAMRAWADARNMAVFAAAPRADRTLEELPVDRPLLLLFGNELEGVRPETLERCDGAFRIPMAGFVESLNVSVSVGITLYSVLGRVRARLAAAGRTGDLPDARRTALKALWCAADLRGAAAILRRALGPGAPAPDAPTS